MKIFISNSNFSLHKGQKRLRNILPVAPGLKYDNLMLPTNLGDPLCEGHRGLEQRNSFCTYPARFLLLALGLISFSSKISTKSKRASVKSTKI